MWERDARTLAESLRRDFQKVEPGNDFIWTAAPPIRVIDCVLSLNRRYDSYVMPRVKAFADRFPDVATCEDLLRLIEQHASPAEFLEETLDTRDPRRAETLRGVTDFVIEVQQRFEGAEETDRLQRWATWARPGDYLAVGVGGFGLAGFQYLRMLFGADTTKPDVHVVRHVSDVLERPVSDVEALYIFERAAEIADLPLRWLDVAIWESRAR